MVLWERIVFCFVVASSSVCNHLILECITTHYFLFLCSIFFCMYSFDKFSSSSVDKFDSTRLKSISSALNLSVSRGRHAKLVDNFSNESDVTSPKTPFKFIDDDCFYYHSWRNNAVIAFGTLSSSVFHINEKTLSQNPNVDIRHLLDSLVSALTVYATAFSSRFLSFVLRHFLIKLNGSKIFLKICNYMKLFEIQLYSTCGNRTSTTFWFATIPSLRCRSNYSPSFLPPSLPSPSFPLCFSSTRVLEPPTTSRLSRSFCCSHFVLFFPPSHFLPFRSLRFPSSRCHAYQYTMGHLKSHHRYLKSHHVHICSEIIFWISTVILFSLRVVSLSWPREIPQSKPTSHKSLARSQKGSVHISDEWKWEVRDEFVTPWQSRGVTCRCVTLSKDESGSNNLCHTHEWYDYDMAIMQSWEI